MEKKLTQIPVAAIKDAVMLPYMLLQLDITRDFCKNAAETALSGGGLLVIVTQCGDCENGTLDFNNVFSCGVLAKLKTGEMPDGRRMLAEGICRCEINSLTKTDGCNFADITETDDLPQSSENLFALAEELKHVFLRYITESGHADPDGIMGVISTSNPSQMLDLMTANVKMPVEIKQEILECSDFAARAELFKKAAIDSINLSALDRRIDKKVKTSLDKRQKEYYLQEQLRVIHEELGDDFQQEIDEYNDKIDKLSCSDLTAQKLKKEVEKLSKMPPVTGEGNVTRAYLDFVLELPWGAKTPQNADMKKAQKILEKDHFGLETVKTRILEHLAVMRLSGKAQGSVLCLVGPPGVGKTSVAKSIARAVGRNYVRISLGGTRDEADIRGHRKTYIGAMPGRILTALREAKSDNPLILLDEIDKMGSDLRGDPSAALLEVLDTAQNSAFRDHYVELPYDLSDIMFIMTANTLDTVPRPLLDRMEIIELSGYTPDEKAEIAKKYLIPRQCELCGLKKQNISIAKSAVARLIDGYTRESGVRELERKIAELCRKAARKIIDGESGCVKVSADNLEKLLEKPAYDRDSIGQADEVGIVTGLAWTQVGGETLSVEVNVMDGSGKIELTGKLGDVMKESAMAAVSYIRSQSDKLGIDKDFYKTKDIHVHVPEGATPKDGPSAGITMATAMVSALTGKPVRRSVAMTGEITIRGKVLPIGGLKEKSLAAYRYGVDTVVIPSKNEKDITLLPQIVRDSIEFIPAESMETVLGAALE